MRPWILLAALLATTANAATFHGFLDGNRVTVRAHLVDAEWHGAFRCRGAACPLHRGTAEWGCAFETALGSVANRATYFAFIGDCDARGGVTGRWYDGTSKGTLTLHR